MIITARPYDVNWSGNGIWYAFFSELAAGTPNTPADTSVVLEIRIRFKRADAADFSIGPVLPLIPIAGKVAINISSMIDAELLFGLPDLLDSTLSTLCATQTGQFYIDYREITAANTDPGWQGDEVAYTRWAVKGGVPEFKFNNNGYWSRYYPTNKPFLTWQLRGRLAGYDEPIYLAWLQKDEMSVQALLQTKYTVYYTDLNLPPSVKKIYIDSKPWQVQYLPAGAGMVDLKSLNADKNIWKYTVEVINVTDPNNIQTLSEVFSFELDNRPDYNPLYVIYRGSTGGLDTLRIRGVVELDANYTLQTTGKAQLPYYDQGNKITRTVYQLPAQEVVLYKGDVGHLQKEEQDRIRDMFLQRELYQQQDKHWWPINLSISQLVLRKNTDQVWSMPIEFSLANEGDKYYAPRQADFGNEYADSNSCDAIVTGIGVLKTFNAGTGVWETSIDFTASSAAGHAIGKVQWMSSLNPGVWNDVNFPIVTSINLNLPINMFITITFRANCANGFGGLQSNVVIDTTVAGSGGGGGGGRPLNNSRITNNTPIERVISLRIDGVQVYAAAIPANGFMLFLVADSAASEVELVFQSYHPITGTLITQGNSYTALVGGGMDDRLVWSVPQIVNGLIISFN